MKLHQLAIAHLALCVIVLLWDLWVAGRAAQLRSAPRGVVIASGLAGLLIVPALTVYILAGSLLTGHAFAAIAWVWPVTVALVAAQALYATARALSSPAIGIPIAIYDTLLALVYAAAYVVNSGQSITTPFLALVAAERGGLALSAQPLALVLPWFLYLPIIAPCAPARRSLMGAGRATMAALSVVWGVLILVALPGAVRAVSSYEHFAAERLRERPDRDFTIGLKVFPTLAAVLPTSSEERDLALADTIGAQALSVYISPRGAAEAELETLAQSLEDARTGRILIVALDLSRAPVAARPAHATGELGSYLDARVRDVGRITRILRPDYVVPVVNPGAPTALGTATPELWRLYITRAAQAARAAGSATRVMVHVGAFGPRDSSLYAWAASSSAPVDALALTLFPGLQGAKDIESAELTVDAWLAAQHPASLKEHWILEAGGYPAVHGDLSQARALWGILAWATNHPAVKGMIAFEASDYTARLGLQTPSGRIRLAAGTLKRAIAGLGE